MLDAVARARAVRRPRRRCAAAVHAEPDAVDAALGRVRGLALLWGTDDALRALSVLTDVVGTRISRLGAPAGGAARRLRAGPGHHAGPATSG